MEISKIKTIGFTGNRTLTSSSGNSGHNLENTICEKLYNLLEREYLENGITTFLSGMALGYDTLAAKVVLELKRCYPLITLVAVIPFDGQDAKFTPQQRIVYQTLLSKADYTITISPDGYSNQAYHDRNDFLIANSIKIYAYHNGKPRSGTGSTIRKASLNGVEVVNIYEI